MSALDIVARGLAARALDSGSVTSADGATTRTAAAKLASDMPLSLLDFYEDGDADMTSAITRLSAAILARGGNCTVLLPRAAAPYESAAPLVIRNSGVRLIIDNPFVYTGGEVVDFIEIGLADEPPFLDGYLTGILVELNADVDMQGASIDWDYETIMPGNALHLTYCLGARIIGRAEVRNGLVDCVKLTCCKDCLVDGVTVRGSIYDNGLSFNERAVGLDPADRSTWNNNIARNVKAIGCRDFGVTHFDAPGGKTLNCEAHGCGTDGAVAETNVESPPGSGRYVTGTPGAAGGGFSFEGYETSGAMGYEGRGLRVYDCFTLGIGQTVDDLLLDDCIIDGVISSSSTVYQGQGIRLIAIGSSLVDGVNVTRAVWRNCRVKRVAKAGFAAQYAGSGSDIRRPDIRFEGVCLAEANGQQGFFINGWSRLAGSQAIEARGNNTGLFFPATDFEVHLEHQDGTTTGGKVSLGRVTVSGTSKYALYVRRAAEVSISEITYDMARNGAVIAQPVLFGAVTGRVRFGRLVGVERTVTAQHAGDPATGSTPGQAVVYSDVGIADIGEINANLTFSSNVPYGFTGTIGALRGKLFSTAAPATPAGAVVEKGQVFTHPAPGAGAISRWRCTTPGALGGSAQFMAGEVLAS